MTHSIPAAAIVAIAAIVTPSHGIVSDQVGVYGLVEEVLLHPDDQNPTRVEVRGVFSVAAGQLGDEYRPATAGYLAFTIEAGQEKPTRDQWRDLRSVAGTGECVAFGTRYSQQGVRVRPVGRGDLATTPYQVHMGVRKVENADYEPIRQLRYVVRPVTPADGAELPVRGDPRPGMRVLFGVHPCAADDGDLRYLFEVTLPDGETLGSPPIEPTKGETTWEAMLPLMAGDEITWRVRVLGAKLAVVPVATARFKAVAKSER